MTYTVKEIADQMDMTEHTIRFYTDKGLLSCSRDKNNRRVFDDESINWLKGIQCLRNCGVSIEDIKVYSKKTTMLTIIVHSWKPPFLIWKAV